MADSMEGDSGGVGPFCCAAIPEAGPAAHSGRSEGGIEVKHWHRLVVAGVVAVGPGPDLLSGGRSRWHRKRSSMSTPTQQRGPTTALPGTMPSPTCKTPWMQP